MLLTAVKMINNKSDNVTVKSMIFFTKDMQTPKLSYNLLEFWNKQKSYSNII